MNSRTTARFREALARLEPAVQARAMVAYRLFRQDPSHPSLRFKPVRSRLRVYSVRIGLGHRALGVREGDTVVWFWIGTHADYDQLLARLPGRR